MFQRENFPGKIYLAEDDQDDSILFTEAVRELYPEITVRISENGQQLLENLYENESENPEILFLDINMPCKNGFECLKEIRSLDRFSSLIIIMFSTSSSTLHVELSYKLGADLYAVKPGSFPQLKFLLGEILTMDWGTIQRNKKSFFLAGSKLNTM